MDIGCQLAGKCLAGGFFEVAEFLTHIDEGLFAVGATNVSPPRQ